MVLIIVILLIGAFLGGYFIKSNVSLEEDKSSDVINYLRAADTIELRNLTFQNCQHLLNQNINFKGKVLYEECGKNCLGGCPNSGPMICYYGVRSEGGCVVYVKSRNIPMISNEDLVFNDFEVGQEVEISGLISRYGACDITSDSCLYLVINE